MTQRGGLYGALATRLTSAPYRQSPSVAIHKGESGDRGRVGPHHPWAEGNGQNEGLCKEAGALLPLEPALGPDQNGKRARAASLEGDDGRGLRRGLVGEDQQAPLVPAVEELGELLRRHHFGHAQNAALLRRLDGIGEQAAGVHPLGDGVARDHGTQRARAELGRLLRHIVEAGALQRREQVMEIGPLLLRARLVLDAELRAFAGDGGHRRAPLPILAVEQEEPIARLEP